MIRNLVLILTTCLRSVNAFSFSSVFGDDMVLQRDAIAAVYGYGATPGAHITVTVSRDESPQARSTVVVAFAAADGTWKALLAAQSASSAAHTITASGTSGETHALSRVLFGDVWFCSGQSNMELGLYYTFSRNATLQSIAASKFANVRLLHFDHNPQALPVWTSNATQIVPPGGDATTNSSWFTPSGAVSMMKDHGCSGSNCQSVFDDFSGTCWYFAQAITERMMSEDDYVDGEEVPLGLIESAFGGTVIESWIDSDVQLASCTNITCSSNQSLHYTKETRAECEATVSTGVASDFERSRTHTSSLSKAIELSEEAELELSTTVTAKGAGYNGELYNGMVLPFVNMTIKGFLWYQGASFLLFSLYVRMIPHTTLALLSPPLLPPLGENNLPYHAGNVLDHTGYACSLPALIKNWRAMFGIVPGTTSSSAPFGIVQLADSTDEGWGSNVPQMHWAQTANHGVVPNVHLPNCFIATAHDLPDPWADGCWEAAECCISTGRPLDPRCNAQHRGWLKNGGVGDEPTTHSMGVTIHPRVKYQVGARLAQAAWSLVYGHPEVAFTGPVLSGCSLVGATLTVRFNTSLLAKSSKAVDVSTYNKTEKASVMWVKTTPLPMDGDKNWAYTNREPWWGDDASWHNIDYIRSKSDATQVVATISEELAALMKARSLSITAIKYGHQSPKGSPQSGEDKICCGNRNFAVDPCAPESCPISSGTGVNKLPAMPFHAEITTSGKCKCFAPQVCDE